MPDNVQQDDDLVINLVELTLTKPEADRESYLRSACGGSQDLFEQVWHYVQWEQRMGRFLLDPLFPPPLEEHHFEPGELLENRFRILREVAQGGMGIVYEALDEKLDRRIAIKCAKSGFSKRLPPEVRHASEISHPNVCKIYEIHTAATDHGEIDFLTMEFLQGETLADLLRRGRLAPEKALLIARQVCAGLAEAHRNQVTHGDLKSNNVIVTAGPDGITRAVITDFGLARRPEASGRTLLSDHEQGGTPDYMAPELWKGARASSSSDVYALGVLLYELASGRRPYPQELSWEQRQRFKPPLVDVKWDRILAHCLEADPSKRFFNADEVAQALAPRSRKWFLSIAAAAVLATGTGVVTYQRTVVPRESVRLAVLPFESTQQTAAIEDKVIAEAAGQIAHLNTGPRVKLTVIAPQEALRRNTSDLEKAKSTLGGTHALHGYLESRKGKIILHAYVTDLRSGVHAKEWTAEYAPDETRYLPIALAGVVTETFHLPALTEVAAVKKSAAKDYWGGLYYIRKNSTVDRAIPLLERAVIADADSPLTHAALAEGEWREYAITQDQKWILRSAESLRQAQLRNPDLAPVHSAAGLHKWIEGWYEQAEQELRRAIELDPANGDNYRWLGNTLESNNQLSDAAAAYSKAIEIAPNDYRNPSAMGTYHYNQANYKEAAKYYRSAMDLEPKEPSTHFALGQVYANLGQSQEAENELRASLGYGETPTALDSLGALLMDEGRDPEAIFYIKKALDKWPARYLWWTNLGTAYKRTKRPVDSQRSYQRGLDLAKEEMIRNPREGRVRSVLAYLYARVDKRDFAESQVAEALKESPSDADTRFWAVLTYEALNERDSNERESTIEVLKGSSAAVLADVSRDPDLADLRRDPRFQDLLASHQLK